MHMCRACVSLLCKQTVGDILMVIYIKSLLCTQQDHVHLSTVVPSLQNLTTPALQLPTNEKRCGFLFHL